MAIKYSIRAWAGLTSGSVYPICTVIECPTTWLRFAVDPPAYVRSRLNQHGSTSSCRRNTSSPRSENSGQSKRCQAKYNVVNIHIQELIVIHTQEL